MMKRRKLRLFCDPPFFASNEGRALELPSFPHVSG
jgi:hypothetical protein